MTLRSRLLFSHSVVIVLAMIAFVAALYSIDNLHGRVDRIAQGRQGIIDSTERIRDEFSNVLRSVIEEGVSEAHDRVRSVAAVGGLRRAIDASRTYFQAPEEKSAFDTLQANFNGFADAVEGWSKRSVAPAESAQRIADTYSRLRAAAVQ